MTKLTLFLSALLIPAMANAQSDPPTLENGELSIITVLDLFATQTNDPTVMLNTFSEATNNTAILIQINEAREAGDALWYGPYVLLDLIRNGEPYAAVRCSWLNRPMNSGEISDWAFFGSGLGPDLGRPFGDATRQRMVCNYTRWDPEADLRPVLNSALAWTESTISPAIQSSNDFVLEGHLASAPDQRDTGRIWAAELQIPVGGVEAEFNLTTILDVPARLN